MAVVRPLRGVRYDPERIGALETVLAPPYDVITPEEQALLYERSAYNVVRLILPRDVDRAAAAARTLRAWIEQRILIRDAEPALYFYSQGFRLADGSEHVRDGVLCRLGLEEFSSGVVRPHERTFPGPKADRLALLRATGAYLSPIFGLYARPGERLRTVLEIAGPPLVAATLPSGETHRLWRVVDPVAIARFEHALAGETVYIADGHHRYETGLAYRREMAGRGDAGAILACLVNMEEEGLIVLPTHRLIKPPLRRDSDRLVDLLRERFETMPWTPGHRPAGAIDLILPDRRLRLQPRPGTVEMLTAFPPVVRRLDVALLEGAILGPVFGIGADALEFTHDDAEAIGAVVSGRAAAALLVNPPTMAQIRDVCQAGELMPEKSTYFFPKLADGLVFDLVGPPWVC